MTREEKARAYDEALKRAKAAMDIAADKDLVEGVVRTILPELAESEDEKIRKTLLEYFNERNSYRDEDETFNGVSFSSIIAYLEKQKEQKPTIELVFPKFRVGDIIRSVRDKWNKTTRRISHVGEHGYNFDYRHLGDKVSGGSFGFSFEDDYELVEQKPAEWDEYTKTNLDRALQIIKKAKGTLQGYQSDDGIYECDKAIECLEHFLYRGLEIEKPVEWDEFDEDCLKRAIWYIENPAPSAVKDTNLVLWLKSLPGRFNFQPKQEWNDEDERKYQCIRNILLTDMSKKIDSWKYSEILEWYEKRGIGRYTNFKPHWKPSEEQMEAFKKYIEEFQARAEAAVGGWNNFDVMIRLYEQLKKL